MFEEEPTALLSVERLRELLIFSVELKVGASIGQKPTGAQAATIVTQLKKELFVRVPTVRWASENPFSKWYKPGYTTAPDGEVHQMGAVLNPSDLDNVSAWATPSNRSFGAQASIKKRADSTECLRIANKAIAKARR